MKLIFALLAVVVTSASAGDHEKRMKDMKDCAKESGVDLKAYFGVMKSSDPITDKMGCCSACIAKKMGIMKEDGSANMERIKAISEKKKKFGEIMTKCASAMKAGDACQSGKALSTCMRDNGFGKKKESEE